MSDPIFKCRVCGRDNFKTMRGLTQHMQSRKACNPVISSRNMFGLTDLGDVEGRKKRMRGMLEMTTISHGEEVEDDTEIVANFTDFDDNVCKYSEEESGNGEESEEGTDSDEEELYANPNIACSDSESDVDEEDMDEETEDFEYNVEDSVESGADFGVPIDELLQNFKEYESKSPYFEKFQKKHRVAVELCRLLRQTKASLATYDLMMQWHFWASGKIRHDQPVSTHPDYVSREKLFKLLRRRYNYDHKKWTMVREIILPYSRARARIVLNDAQAAMQSLLTDPRIRDEDYLFFDDNPFAPPPDNLDYIGDLNTGRSYIETYKALIRDPSKEILLPIVFYADAAVTGQFVALSVTAVQFSLGIFSRVARDKEHMWRTLGYIPSYCKVASRGKGYFKQTGHADAPMAYQNTYLENEGDVLEDNTKVSAQDLHAMFDVILESFLPLQDRGFYWDLHYKGITYENVKFVPFVIFFKADTEEAEKLCGSYNAHTENVSQLCRYCECPTQDSDNHLGDFYRLKTKNRIQRLVDRGDEEKLKELSQQNIDNALYKLRMGMHSRQHIHGACPMEMLHAILLGIFGYVRDMLFEQCGPKSKLAEEINGLATESGMRLARQSERDMPKTKFAGGITRGKLQAKEHTGILLCILAVLCSTKGEQLLRDRKKKNFAEVGLVEDWIRLVETLLEWEEWLKSPTMQRNHVQYRLRYKHQYLMYLMRVVGKRKSGMGLKLVKFHSILHMRHDILNFGVPMEYDTGSNESGHKKTKRAAKLTQKREETFDEQVDIRLQEEHLLEMASEEMNGRKLWNYREGHQHPEEAPPKEELPCLGGAKYEAYKDVNGRNCIRLTSRANKKERPGQIESQLVEFLIGLNEKVSPFMGSVPMRTLHKRGGLKFRASPCFMKEIWRDWVMVDWGDHGKQACKIYGFVDLSQIPPDSPIEYGGIEEVGPGLYAIVENSYLLADDEDDDTNAHLFIPIRKEVQEITTQMVSKLKFYLADVEAFASPLVVIPDMGGNANDYFLLRSRQEWSQRFVRFLETSNHHYPMDVLD